MDFGAGAGRDGHGNEAEAGDESGHGFGSEPRERALPNGFFERLSFRAELVDKADQHDAVEDGNAAERDETDGSGDTEGHVAQGEREDSAGDGQGNTEENERGLPQRLEREKDKGEDKSEGSRDNNHEAVLCVLEIFELATEFEKITGRKRQFGGERCLSFLDEAVDVVTAQVDENGSATAA